MYSRTFSCLMNIVFTSEQVVAWCGCRNPGHVLMSTACVTLNRENEEHMTITIKAKYYYKQIVKHVLFIQAPNSKKLQKGLVNGCSSEM